MASKLKDLEVTKVDFVDQGDNKGANLMLFKKREDQPEAETPEPARPDGVLRRFVAGLFKSVGASEDQTAGIIEEIIKSGGEAETFGEKMLQQQLRRASDEIWDFCYALNESLCSILRDQDVPAESKSALMNQSVAEFSAAVAAAIPKWSAGVPTKVAKSADTQLTEERLQIAKEAKGRLDAMIRKAEPETAPGTPGTKPAEARGDKPVESEEPKGDNNDMKIDKSKLSPEELASLEAIEKKAGIPEETTPATAPAAPAADPVAKSTESADTKDGGDDIYKGMHPAVAEELRNLRKFREEAEDREIMAVAKKYKLLGKKPEELAQVLKSLKAAGGSAYTDMISVLDANLAVVQASPAFTEIGKRGGYGAPATDADTAWAKIEKKAEEIMKSAPTLTRAQAIDKACEQNPDLVHEYEGAR